MTKMLDQAERNERGELIYTKVVPAGPGSTKEIVVDVTTLLSPGARKTSDVELLLIEARHAADPDKSVGNPARPARGEVAKEAIERIEQEDLEPAWRVVDSEVFP